MAQWPGSPSYVSLWQPESTKSLQPRRVLAIPFNTFVSNLPSVNLGVAQRKLNQARGMSGQLGNTLRTCFLLARSKSRCHRCKANSSATKGSMRRARMSLMEATLAANAVCHKERMVFTSARSQPRCKTAPAKRSHCAATSYRTPWRKLAETGGNWRKYTVRSGGKVRKLVDTGGNWRGAWRGRARHIHFST